MTSLSCIRATGLAVVVALGHTMPTIGHAEQLLPVADLESRTMATALEALAESDKKVDRDTVKREIEAISRLGGDATVRSLANVRIVNGLRTALFPAVGSVLKGGDQSRTQQWCTGTLIGSRHVLTAAHCIEKNPDPAAYHIFFQNAGLFAIEKLFWQEKYEFPNADIAVLRLVKPVRGIRPMELNLEKEPPTGTSGTIVGFGRSGGKRDDYGIKRMGSVKLGSCTATKFKNVTDLLCWEYAALSNAPGVDSNTCDADSGGPMLWGGVSPTQLVVAGVTSGGTRTDCLATDVSYDVSVFAHSNWIVSVVGTDLGQATDVPPAVGDEGTEVLAKEGRLTPSKTAAAYDFQVTNDTREVRIAFNGEDDGRNSHDFDLEVSFIADDGTHQPLCRVAEQSQFGVCSFDDPSPGMWRARLSRKAGEGLFQVIATQFY